MSLPRCPPPKDASPGPVPAVGAVAARTLRARLREVWRRLAPAAEQADEDVEHVHRLRVAARRAQAALDLFADLLPGRRASRLGDDLKRVRRAANDARDYDILLADLTRGRAAPGRHGLDDLRRRRARAQRRIRDAYERLRHSRFRRRVARLLRRVGPPGPGRRAGDVPFGAWARLRLRPAVHRFFQTATTGAGAAELHRFRIRAKELRYTMELLADAFSPAIYEPLYLEVADVQDRLGEINDRAAGQAHLRERTDATEDAQAAQELGRSLAEESAALDRARGDFLAWWTPGRREAFRLAFKELLAGAPGESSAGPRGGDRGPVN